MPDSGISSQIKALNSMHNKLNCLNKGIKKARINFG